MTWLKKLKPLHPGCTKDRDLKILSVDYFKNQNSCSLKKCFRILLHVMIINEVPVTILQASFFLQRHIRKVMLIRWIIRSDQWHKTSFMYNWLPALCTIANFMYNWSDLSTTIGCQQFRKQSRKLQRRINYVWTYTPWTIIVAVLQLRDVPKTIIWLNQNGGAQAVVRGGTVPWPPPLATAPWYALNVPYLKGTVCR